MDTQPQTLQAIIGTAGALSISLEDRSEFEPVKRAYYLEEWVNTEQFWWPKMNRMTPS